MNKGNQKGITLIALIITIIVMLILVAVTVRTAVNSGLFGHVKDATERWASEQNKEAEILGNNSIKDIFDKYVPEGNQNENSAQENDTTENNGTEVTEELWHLEENITSPNYPRPHPKNIYDVIERKYDNDVVGVKIVFKEIFVEMDEYARFDRITIKDENNNLVYVTSGRGNPTIVMEDNYMKLSFLADYANSYRGYSAEIYTTRNKNLVKEELKSQNITLPKAIYFDEIDTLSETFEMDINTSLGDGTEINVFSYALFNTEVNPNWSEVSGDLAILYIYDENNNLVASQTIPSFGGATTEENYKTMIQKIKLQNVGSHFKFVLERNNISGLSLHAVIHEM